MKRLAAFVILAVAAGLLSTPSAFVTAAAAPPTTVAQALAQLDDLNNQVDQANAKVDAANLKLGQDQQAEATLADQTSAIARLQYKRPSLLIQLFGAGSLSQVLGDLSSDQLLASKERKLLDQSRTLRREDQRARDQAAAALATIKAARDAAKKLADQLAAQQAAAEALARAAAVAQPWTGAGPWPNHFSYGYCTWYVANRRYIPWFGNAIEWWPNARPYGYAEGQLPQVGAVMVTRESGYGHVAYVEAVNPNGSWTVSEMNYTGWNQVDRRTIFPGQVPLVGFIY